MRRFMRKIIPKILIDIRLCVIVNIKLCVKLR